MYKLSPKSHIASIDVDAQYSFTPECPNDLPVPNGADIVDELNRQADFAGYRLGTKEAHSPKAIWVTNNEKPILSPICGENVDVCWPAHCIPGTKGFESLKGLPHPTQYDFFVWKGVELDMHPYGACFHDIGEKLSTGIIEFLKSKEIKTVIIGGLATDYCVKNTALQLQRAGFQTIVNLAACRGLHATSTQAAIDKMLQEGVIIIESLQALISTSRKEESDIHA